MIAVRVIAFLKPGVLDAQGQAVQQGLEALGYAVERVRVGRAFELVLPEQDWEENVRRMCERYLTNPLIEEYRYERLGPAAPPAKGQDDP
ncbi:MAG: phosphoribosylformylglycinamidine synthase subunit PurS [Planctomycetota bacterium]|nr:MAG: phosphoribosylformylglycinamidine synthase subunit PurS [Planctomycetota bacterium]